MATIGPSDEALRSAARAWVVTLVSGDVDAATLSAFEQWRDALAVHGEAFEEARRDYVLKVRHPEIERAFLR